MSETGAVSKVIWHDLECGRYEQDLALWLQLAADHVSEGDAVLDVGAGTGRVSLALARGGHRVVALDRDADLLSELERRAAGLPIQSVCADARNFDLGSRRFSLIAVPMQTLQLLGGPDGHLAFLNCARAHLGPGGIVAVAIAAAEDFEEFEYNDGDLVPLPDVVEIAGCSYFSQPTAVRRDGSAFVLERRREVVTADGTRDWSTDRIALDILTVADLNATAARAGLRPLTVHRVRPTEEHIGSEVVILGG